MGFIHGSVCFGDRWREKCKSKNTCYQLNVKTIINCIILLNKRGHVISHAHNTFMLNPIELQMKTFRHFHLGSDWEKKNRLSHAFWPIEWVFKSVSVLIGWIVEGTRCGIVWHAGSFARNTKLLLSKSILPTREWTTWNKPWEYSKRLSLTLTELAKRLDSEPLMSSNWVPLF